MVRFGLEEEMGVFLGGFDGCVRIVWEDDKEEVGFFGIKRERFGGKSLYMKYSTAPHMIDH